RGPRCRGPRPPRNVRVLGSLHVRGLGALRALDDLERHALPFGQRLVAVHRDRGEVDEDVVAVLTRDEAVALLVREPLHCALLRQATASFKNATARAMSRRPMHMTAPRIAESRRAEDVSRL